MYDYKTTTMTCSLSFNDRRDMNLYNLANFIEIDNVILGLRYLVKPGVILIRGEYSKETRPFHNQISMIIALENSRRVNVKIFKNGSLHITGCKLLSDPDTVHEILERYYKVLNSKMITIELTKTADGVYLTNDNMMYSVKNQTVFGYINEQSETWTLELIKNLLGSKTKLPYTIGKDSVSLNKDGNFMSDKSISNKKTLYDIDGCIIGNIGIKLYNKCSKLFKSKNLIIDYHKDEVRVNDNIIGQVTYTYRDIPPSITPVPNTEGNYSCSVYDERASKEYSVDVNSINILTSTGFKLNRRRLYNSLFSKDCLTLYDPSKYCGVRLMFKNVCFVIFQSGNIIGSGFKTYTNVNDNIKRLYNILEEYKDVIIQK